jgi:hypothetical protein
VPPSCCRTRVLAVPLRPCPHSAVTWRPSCIALSLLSFSSSSLSSASHVRAPRTRVCVACVLRTAPASSC